MKEFVPQAFLHWDSPSTNTIWERKESHPRSDRRGDRFARGRGKIEEADAASVKAEEEVVRIEIVKETMMVK